MTPKRGLWLRWLPAKVPQWHARSMLRGTAAVLGCLALLCSATGVRGQCPEIGPFASYDGAGQVACPCFVTGEQAGVILDVPAQDYPIEILKIGIGWASPFGGAGQSLEEAIHIYEGTLPNPGAPTYSLPGPLLTDGYINEFPVEFTPGDRIIDSGPFMVTLEFMNSNANNPFLASVFSDGNGCRDSMNVVYAIPGGWTDACDLGITGDWVFYVKYRSLSPSATTNPGTVQFAGVPGNQTTCETVYVRNEGCADLIINSIAGCGGVPFNVDTTATNHTIPPGDSTGVTVCVTPTTMSPELCTLEIATNDGTRMVDVSVGGVVTGVITGVTVAEPLSLFVFPNPFNPSTSVRFTLPAPASANVEIYRVDGTRVRVLERDHVFNGGENIVSWDGRDDRGDALSSGIYWVRVTSRFGALNARAVLLK